MTRCLFAVFLAAAAAASYPPSGYKLMRSEDSPRHSFRVETLLSDSGAAVWLRDSGSHAVQLWSRDGNPIDPFVYVSPDERWIVCVQKLYHGASGAWLYEGPGAAANYSEIGPRSFGDAAWDFFRTQTHRPFEQNYHFIISTGTWLPQSHALLVELTGDDRHTFVRGWYCYYDLEKHRFYLDAALEKKNQHAVSDASPKRPNQTLQPTAERCENLHMTTSTLKFVTQLALISGG